jgi:hypothetical protein
VPTCTKCGEDKPEESFYRRGTGRLRHDCRSCCNKGWGKPTVPPEHLAFLKAHRIAGTLEPMLMEAHFGTSAIRAAVAAQHAIREQSKDENQAVADRIARGGREAPKPSDLSNNLPDGPRSAPWFLPFWKGQVGPGRPP